MDERPDRITSSTQRRRAIVCALILGCNRGTTYPSAPTSKTLSLIVEMKHKHPVAPFPQRGLRSREDIVDALHDVARASQQGGHVVHLTSTG